MVSWSGLRHCVVLCLSLEGIRERLLGRGGWLYLKSFQLLARGGPPRGWKRVCSRGISLCFSVFLSLLPFFLSFPCSAHHGTLAPAHRRLGIGSLLADSTLFHSSSFSLPLCQVLPLFLSPLLFSSLPSCALSLVQFWFSSAVSHWCSFVCSAVSHWCSFGWALPRHRSSFGWHLQCVSGTVLVKFCS